jgi:alkylated DNA nucleotide flippase Atl1
VAMALGPSRIAAVQLALHAADVCQKSDVVRYVGTTPHPRYVDTLHSRQELSWWRGDAFLSPVQ